MPATVRPRNTSSESRRSRERLGPSMGTGGVSASGGRPVPRCSEGGCRVVLMEAPRDHERLSGQRQPHPHLTETPIRPPASRWTLVRSACGGKAIGGEQRTLRSIDAYLRAGDGLVAVVLLPAEEHHGDDGEEEESARYPHDEAPDELILHRRDAPDARGSRICGIEDRVGIRDIHR